MSYKSPIVSVIMGVYCSNEEDIHKMERAVRSVLSQTFADFEFLICENGSIQEAIEELAFLEAEDSRIRLIHDTNADTLAKKLNLCIEQARGRWIARMDADDYSYNIRFERQMCFLQAHSECVLVGSWVREVGGSSETTRELPLWPQVKDFRIKLPFVHPTLMFRRDVVLTAGKYSESSYQEGCDDYDLLLRLYELGYYGANLQEVLLDYSIVSSQLRHRPYRLFVNESFTRLVRFKKLGLLPVWLPWVVKPLLVGIIPRRCLYRLKH